MTSLDELAQQLAEAPYESQIGQIADALYAERRRAEAALTRARVALQALQGELEATGHDEHTEIGRLAAEVAAALATPDT